MAAAAAWAVGLLTLGVCWMEAGLPPVESRACTTPHITVGLMQGRQWKVFKWLVDAANRNLAVDNWGRLAVWGTGRNPLTR